MHLEQASRSVVIDKHSKAVQPTTPEHLNHLEKTDMQLRNLKFWQRDQEKSTASVTEPRVSEEVIAQNVVKMPLETPLDNPTGISGVLPTSDTMYINVQAKPVPSGPMTAGPINEFFSRNFVNHGRYAGATQRSSEALALGMAAVMSQFQNAISLVISEKRSKLDNLQNVAAQSEGVSDIVSTQLHLAREKLERDISILREQLELADQRRGWILSALNEYRIGFDRGLREAVDAELLGL
jgi:hypothetical protein